MVIRLISFSFLIYLAQLLSAPLQVADNTANLMMTKDQALSTLRSKSSDAPNVEFIVVRKLEPTLSTRVVAKVGLNEARSKHLEVYGSGILVNMMREGGYVILEFDPRTDIAIRLHMITQDEAEKAVVLSKNIDGDLSRSDALTIFNRSEALGNSLLTSPGQELSDVLYRFGGARLPTYSDPGDLEYFAIPEGVAGLKVPSDELRELVGLSGSLHVWPIRFALTMPIFAVNPEKAIRTARDDEIKLANEFQASKKESPGLIDLLDLNSINTPEKLTERVQRLRELNAFFDERRPINLDSPTFQANAWISVAPLFAGVIARDSVRSYAVMNASGLIVVWSRTGTGEFVLRGLSEAGD